jgi:enamine deaminase RidA (YjgF/YER057c/UK114 family)
VIVGDLLFVSGHVAIGKDGNVVGVGDAEAQTRQVMANIQDVVTAVGGKMEDVAKILVRPELLVEVEAIVRLAS